MSFTTAEQTLEPPTAADPPAAVAPAPPPAEHGWVWQVTALSVVLGVMLALAIRTTVRIRNSGFPGPRLGISAAFLSRFKDQNERLQAEIKTLRDKIQQFEESAADKSKSTELLNRQLQEIKGFAGMSAVEGPGLQIQLRDSPETRLPNLTPEDYSGYMIHDQDINGLINELKAAGAEAIAISGADPDNLQRVVATTAARCVGPNAVVNGTQLSAPYTILAIGNPKELRAALEMPEGYIQMRSLDVLKMIVIEEKPRIVVPGYTGTTNPRHARPASKDP